MLKIALAEDDARNDITSRSVIPQKSRIKAAVLAKESGILAGIDLAVRVFKLQDNNLSVRTLKKDGSAIKPGQAVLTVEGSARSIFAAERVVLNFLGHLSGIATLTRAFVAKTRGTRAKVFDTRKTLPGLRALEKYAVKVGGGMNHRFGLDDAVLIKTNHLRAYSVERIADRNRVRSAIEMVKRKAKGKLIEIEVANFSEFRAAIDARPHIILLDNWSLRNIRKAVLYAQRSPLSARPLLEVSGGVTLANVRAFANTGVDRISIGRLTHSASALDVSLEVLP